MKVHNVIITLFCTFLLAACSRNSSGAYSGNCQNQTYETSAEMALILNDKDGRLTGSLTLSGDCVGGGSIEGRRDGNTISFVTKSVYGQITWSGSLDGNTIEGSYIVESSPAYVAATGFSRSQRGIWSVSRR